MVADGNDPYKYYAEQATKLGLTAGFYFKFKDSGHVQNPSANGATDVYTWSYMRQHHEAALQRENRCRH